MAQSFLCQNSSFRFLRFSFSFWQKGCEIYVKHSITIYNYKNTYYGYRVLVTGFGYIGDIYLVYTCTDNGIG